MKEGGIMKVDISKKMIDYVGRSHQLYQAAQKENKKTSFFEKKSAWKEKG